MPSLSWLWEGSWGLASEGRPCPPQQGPGLSREPRHMLPWPLHCPRPWLQAGHGGVKPGLPMSVPTLGPTGAWMSPAQPCANA